MFFVLFLIVKGNRKCELNCQAMGYRFYVRQAEKVIDGTPCDQNGTAICVSGQCKVSARTGCLQLILWVFVLEMSTPLCFARLPHHLPTAHGGAGP